MEDIRSAIKSANQKFMDAFGRKDAAGVAALYTKDAKLLPPDMPIMSGTDAIQSYWRGAMDMGIRDARLETLAVEARDELAYEVGRFDFILQPQGGESRKMAGQYVVVWKNEGGWKLHVDIWNNIAPA